MSMVHMIKGGSHALYMSAPSSIRNCGFLSSIPFIDEQEKLKRGRLGSQINAKWTQNKKLIDFFSYRYTLILYVYFFRAPFVELDNTVTLNLPYRVFVKLLINN